MLDLRELGLVAPYSPEGIAQNLNVGSILFRRWLGAWVDFVVLGLCLLLPDQLLGNRTYQATIWMWLAVVVLYFPLAEGTWGRTIGKLVTGTVVVDSHGRPPGFRRAGLRTLLRLIEVNPFLLGGLPAAIAVLASENRQRIGDMAAGTFVIPARELARARAGVA